MSNLKISFYWYKKRDHFQDAHMYANFKIKKFNNDISYITLNMDDLNGIVDSLANDNISETTSKFTCKFTAFIHFNYCLKKKKIYSPLGSSILSEFKVQDQQDLLLDHFYSALKTSSTSKSHDRLVLSTYESIKSNIDCMSEVLKGDLNFKGTNKICITNFTPISFDPCPMEWLLFLEGFRDRGIANDKELLMIENDNEIMLTENLLEILKSKSDSNHPNHDQNQLIIPQITPSLFSYHKQLLTNLPNLKILIFGGESWIPKKLFSGLKISDMLDQNTQIYNFYGQTEMSCWTSYFRVPKCRGFYGRDEFLEFGRCVFGTEVEFIGGRGNELDDQDLDLELQISSKTRKNIILDKSHDTISIKTIGHDPNLKYQTGDKFIFKNGKFIFKNRSKIVKINSKRVNLSKIEEEIFKILEKFWKNFKIDSVHVFLDEKSKLLIANVLINAEVSEKTKFDSSEIQNLISNYWSLEDYMKPIYFEFVETAIPKVPIPRLTNHYKADYSNLYPTGLALTSSRKRNFLKIGDGISDTNSRKVPKTELSNQSSNISDFKRILLECLNSKSLSDLDLTKSLTFNGYDSLMAIKLETRVETIMERPIKNLLENILTKSLNELIEIYKDLKAGRGTVVLEDKCYFEVDTTPHERDQERSQNFTPTNFSINLHGCIDAPCLIDETLKIIFQGSHSGLFTAFDLYTGKVFWEIVLDGPILSKPLREETVIIISTRPGTVYKILIKNGKILGKFRGQERDVQVKHGFWVENYGNENGHENEKILKIADYDKNLYTLDFNTFTLINKTKRNSGIIMNRPVYMPSNKEPFLTTFLSGHLKLGNNENSLKSGSIMAEVAVYRDSSTELAVIATTSGKVFLVNDRVEIVSSNCGQVSVIAKPIVLDENHDENSLKTIAVLDISGQISFYRHEKGNKRLELVRKINLPQHVGTSLSKKHSNNKFLSFKNLTKNQYLISSTKIIFIYDIKFEKIVKIIEENDKDCYFSPVEVVKFDKKILIFYGSRLDWFTCKVFDLEAG